MRCCGPEISGLRRLPRMAGVTACDATVACRRRSRREHRERCGDRDRQRASASAGRTKLLFIFSLSLDEPEREGSRPLYVRGHPDPVCLKAQVAIRADRERWELRRFPIGTLHSDAMRGGVASAVGSRGPAGRGAVAPAQASRPSTVSRSFDDRDCVAARRESARGSPHGDPALRDAVRLSGCRAARRDLPFGLQAAAAIRGRRSQARRKADRREGQGAARDRNDPAAQGRVLQPDGSRLADRSRSRLRRSSRIPRGQAPTGFKATHGKRTFTAKLAIKPAG